jgi:hypothetical protein
MVFVIGMVVCYREPVLRYAIMLIIWQINEAVKVCFFWQSNISTRSIKMTDNIENIVIEHLKALRGELKEFRNKHDADMADIKHRLTALERGMGTVKRDASDYYEGQVGQQITIDRLSERLDRIERRLELT